MRKRFSALRCSAIAGCALLAAVMLIGCKGKGSDPSRIVYHYGDSYELADGQSVTFYLDNFTANDANGKKTTTYLRLTDVFLNVTIGDGVSEGSLKLDRSPTAAGVQQSYCYEFAGGRSHDATVDRALYG